MLHPITLTWEALITVLVASNNAYINKVNDGQISGYIPPRISIKQAS